MLIPQGKVRSKDSKELDAKAFTQSEIEKYWEELEPFVQKSIDVSDGDITLDAVKYLLATGSATAFATILNGKFQAVLVVDIVLYSTYRSARILCCAGRKLKEAMKFIGALEVWALSHEAVQIEGWCRPGVVRLVRRLGFIPRRTSVVYDLRRKLQ